MGLIQLLGPDSFGPFRRFPCLTGTHQGTIKARGENSDNQKSVFQCKGSCETRVGSSSRRKNRVWVGSNIYIQIWGLGGVRIKKLRKIGWGRGRTGIFRPMQTPSAEVLGAALVFCYTSPDGYPRIKQRWEIFGRSTGALFPLLATGDTCKEHSIKLAKLCKTGKFLEFHSFSVLVNP